MSITNHRGLQVVVGIVATAFFGWISFGMWQEVVAAHFFGSYSSTEGTLIQSSVATSTSRRGGGRIYLDVDYSFQVEGRQYNGSRVGFGTNRFSSKERAEEALVTLKGTPTITVYFANANPRHSALNPEIEDSWLSTREFVAIFPTALSVLCAVAVVWTAVAGARSR